MEISAIKEQICDVCHKMWQLGWVAANDGNVTALLEDGTLLATPTGMSKSFITPEKLIRINAKGEVLEAAEGLRPSSEIKMHLRCYEKRPDVKSVIHAHPPAATGFAVAHRSMDMYNMIEDVAAIGSVPLTPYGTPSTSEVPDAIEPYLDEHDVMLLENHGALAVGSDVVTAFYRNGEPRALGEDHDQCHHSRRQLRHQPREHRQAHRSAQLLPNHSRHPGYKKYPRDEGEPTDR